MNISEFSRPIALDRIGLKEKSYDITADEKERAALAERLGIPAVNSFDATIRLRLTGGGGLVRLSGHIKAELTQICVVTLEPITNTIDEPVEALFVPEAELEAVTRALDKEAEATGEVADPPEPIVDGQIDLGKLAADALFLAIDPYPRKPDAAFAPPAVEEDPDAHPFAALKALKDNLPPCKN